MAKKMREEADKFEGQLVSVRKEDKSLKPFVIPLQKTGIKGQNMITINHVVLPGMKIYISMHCCSVLSIVWCHLSYHNTNASIYHYRCYIVTSLVVSAFALPVVSYVATSTTAVMQI